MSRRPAQTDAFQYLFAKIRKRFETTKFFEVFFNGSRLRKNKNVNVIIVLTYST